MYIFVPGAASVHSFTYALSSTIWLKIENTETKIPGM